MFGIQNEQDSEYTGLFHMEYIVNCIRTKPFVWIKANFGIHKIRNRQIILYDAFKATYMYIVFKANETKIMASTQQVRNIFG